VCTVGSDPGAGGRVVEAGNGISSDVFGRHAAMIEPHELVNSNAKEAQMMSA
jgi:hypothetical protein